MAKRCCGTCARRQRSGYCPKAEAVVGADWGWECDAHKPRATVDVEAQFWRLATTNTDGCWRDADGWVAQCHGHSERCKSRLAAMRAAVRAYEGSGAK